MPDPTPVALPDESLLARAAGAMFAEATHRVATLGGIPGGAGMPLPSHAHPPSFSVLEAVPFDAAPSLYVPVLPALSGAADPIRSIEAADFGQPRLDMPALDLAVPDEALLQELLAPGDGAATHHMVPLDTDSSYYFLEVPAAAAASPAGFDVDLARRDFPILSERVNGKRLIWLDNAATTQKPQAVINRLSAFYAHENSNVHRAAHELAARATQAYETARETVRRFLNAGSADEIVFVRGTTEAINLVANTWGRRFIGRGDEILVTWLEHHANIVPWQMLCEQSGAVLKVAPVDDRGQIVLAEYGKLLGPRTKLVSFTHVSNVIGTVTPAKVMTEMAHAAGARVLLDGAQSVSHLRSDVQALDVDWFVFSGHKVFGPTGIGALYGKSAVLAESPPWQGGGNMIADVTFEHTVYKPPPDRFEAGTGNIADAVGLGTALEYVERIGIEAIGRHEHELLEYARRRLQEIPGLRLIGSADERAGVLSFVLAGFEATQVGTALNQDGIAVRAGHHCAQPIVRRFGLEATVRPSLALYNTCTEIDTLAAAVRRIQSGRPRS